jgi:Holliday junction resolvase RusA-like endonuclease
MLTLSLPLPPSSNNAFANRKGGTGFGRVKSGRYRAWIKQADVYYALQRLGSKQPITGPYTCKMVFPPRMRGDLENRSKLIMDWLVSRGLTPDDKHLQGLILERDNEFNTDHVWIVVRGADVRPVEAAAGSKPSRS